MAAMLVEYPTILTAPVPVRQAPKRRDERTAAWTPRDARGCVNAGRAEGVRVDAAAASGGRLTWTPRGIAVMVSLVAIVVGVMFATLVMAFLAVSNEPLEAALTTPLVTATDAASGSNP